MNIEGIDLSDFFQTKAQANVFFAGLERLSGSIYKTGFNLEKELVKEFGIQKKDLFMRLLKDNDIDMKSNSVLKSFLDKLMDRIGKLPVLSMTIAFEPTDVILKALCEWVFMNVNQQIVFDITVNHNVIGGAIINFKGKQLDCSCKPVFDKVTQQVLSEQPKPKAPTLHQSLEHITFGR